MTFWFHYWSRNPGMFITIGIAFGRLSRQSIEMFSKNKWIVFKNSLIKYISYLGLLFPSHLKILHTKLRFWKLNLCFFSFVLLWKRFHKKLLIFIIQKCRLTNKWFFSKMKSNRFLKYFNAFLCVTWIHIIYQILIYW